MMHSMQSVVLASLSRVPQQCCSLQEEPQLHVCFCLVTPGQGSSGLG